MLLLIVILATVLAFGLQRVRSTVEANFGKPDPKLGIVQRLRQTLSLYRSGSVLSLPNALPEETKFSIEFAEPVSSVCARLEAEGAVHNAQFVCSYLIYTGLDRGLQAGQFTILPQTSSIQVAQRITDPKLKDVLFTIYPGWRLEEVANAISLAGLPVTLEDIAATFKFPSADLSTLLNLPSDNSIEGYFCPGSYALKPETQLAELSTSLTECQSNYLADKGLMDNLNAHGLTYDQGLTLASIIQRETLEPSEMPTIASVFYNRLAQGMMLQTDPTVQYALGYDRETNTWWRSPLTYADLEVVSPYNTYRVTGLPPGPISTPSADAIKAVAHPTETNYLYFRAKCDGSMTHAFSITYEEHLLNACP